MTLEASRAECRPARKRSSSAGARRGREEVGTATVHIRFYAELEDLLAGERRGREFTHVCPVGESVKDLIEGLGIPHTEIDLLLVNGIPVDFARQIEDGDRVSAYPVFEGLDISSVTLVRPSPLRVARFVADVHLGRLAGYLRLGGFDTLYQSNWQDDELAQVAACGRRILLTRDRGLLKRTIVTHGYLVRAASPRSQLAEVLERLDLWGALQPLSRCSICNGAVNPVAKALVMETLPPRTAAHYEEFWRCADCDRVYWQGAHYRSLLELFSRRDNVTGREPPPRE